MARYSTECLILLALPPRRKWTTASELVEALGRSLRDVEEAIAQLTNDGRVELSGDGVRLTPEEVSRRAA
jgi:DNA-binding IscR family transcriptional regulator